MLFNIFIGSPEASIPLWNLVTDPVEVVSVVGTKQLNESVKVTPSQEVNPAAAYTGLIFAAVPIESLKP